MMVIPAYLYRRPRHARRRASSARFSRSPRSSCASLCVVVDLGRPDRFWHLIPGHRQVQLADLDAHLGRHRPQWLPAHQPAHRRLPALHALPRPEARTRRWYVPFVFLSIFWAISIHTVTAFLYCGLGGRPFWNTALLAPRFLASAFVSGPGVHHPAAAGRPRRAPTSRSRDGPGCGTLVQIIRVTVVVNLFMLALGAVHRLLHGRRARRAARYLFFGDHGKHGLVPWIWTAVALNVGGTALFFTPARSADSAGCSPACVVAFVGIWIEKGMGLISPVHPEHAARGGRVRPEPDRVEGHRRHLGVRADGADRSAQGRAAVFTGEVSVARRSFTSLPPSAPSWGTGLSTRPADTSEPA